MTLAAPTVRFGELTYGPDDVIDVAGGLPPFRAAQRFVLVADEQEAPFLWLQSVDEPGLAVAVAPLDLLFPEHDARVRASVSARAEGGPPEDMRVYGLIVLHPDPLQMTVNLAAPVVVNARRMTAEQVVLDVPVHMTRCPLVEALSAPQPT